MSSIKIALSDEDSENLVNLLKSLSPETLMTILSKLGGDVTGAPQQAIKNIFNEEEQANQVVPPEEPLGQEFAVKCEEEKQVFRQLVASLDIKEALEMIINKIYKKSSHINSFLNLLADSNEIRRQLVLGGISNTEEMQLKRKVVLRTLYAIDELTIGDFTFGQK